MASATESMSKNSLRNALDRLEPWAVFLPILGILFLDSGKSVFWLVLFCVSLIKLLRAWQETWSQFSPDAMRELVGTFLVIPALGLLYIALHGFSPGFVHDLPDTSSMLGVVHKMTASVQLENESASNGWSGQLLLSIKEAKGGFELYGVLGADDARDKLYFEARLNMDDVIRSASNAYKSPLVVHDFNAWLENANDSIVYRAYGVLELNETGKPRSIQINNPDGFIFKSLD